MLRGHGWSFEAVSRKFRNRAPIQTTPRPQRFPIFVDKPHAGQSRSLLLPPDCFHVSSIVSTIGLKIHYNTSVSRRCILIVHLNVFFHVFLPTRSMKRRSIENVDTRPEGPILCAEKSQCLTHFHRFSTDRSLRHAF